MPVFLSFQIVFPEISHQICVQLLLRSISYFEVFIAGIISLLCIYTTFHVMQMWFQSGAFDNTFKIVLSVVNNLENAVILYKYLYIYL